jgi:subtilisin family serine protease
MKLFLLIGAFLLSFQTAHAERWILKNPKLNHSTRFGQVKVFSLDTNSYAVVEANGKFSAQSLKAAFKAESVFKDLRIELIAGELSHKDGGDDDMSKAWHVDLLKYDQLDKKTAGQGITVAVIDTGVDYTHSALKNKMWVNTKEIPNNGLDDDNNGFIDDVYGYDFDGKSSNPQDTMGHGTHCSGIIAAEQKANSNAQGVAQDARIMALRIIGDDQKGFLSNAAMAVKYAVDNGAKVLSNSWRLYKSWGGYENPESLQMLVDALKYAEAHGVIFVNAAGNEQIDLDNYTEDTMYPYELVKDFNNYVAIASSSLKNGSESLSYYSNFAANHVPLAAPGEDIISTYPGNTWVSMSGTSMATPLVAGILARGLSHGYTWQEAINKLEQTSVQTTYWQQYVKYGRVDILKYLQ